LKGLDVLQGKRANLPMVFFRGESSYGRSNICKVQDMGAEEATEFEGLSSFAAVG
jgi:hypothetical protein